MSPLQKTVTFIFISPCFICSSETTTTIKDRRITFWKYAQRRLVYTWECDECSLKRSYVMKDRVATSDTDAFEANNNLLIEGIKLLWKSAACPDIGEPDEHKRCLEDVLIFLFAEMKRDAWQRPKKPIGEDGQRQ